MLQTVEIARGGLTLIAGPCAIESEVQIHEIAQGLAEVGTHVLRGGALKPRTSPYDFQGVGYDGYQWLSDAARANGLASISEVMDEGSIHAAYDAGVDILQVGSRNMQNTSLLKLLGQIDRPVFLKRAFSATYSDLLNAAEYIIAGGNKEVILCERGIRTFESHTRNTLDLAAVPALHEMSALPVVVDPSHGTGRRSLVGPMAYAAVAAGADGLMIEVHPNPDQALSDGPQTLSLQQFAALIPTLQAIRSIKTV